MLLLTDGFIKKYILRDFLCLVFKQIWVFKDLSPKSSFSLNGVAWDKAVVVVSPSPSGRANLTLVKDGNSRRRFKF